MKDYLLHYALSQLRFNDLQKHQLDADTMRMCLAHPDWMNFVFHCEKTIFWFNHYLKSCTLIF